MLQGALTLIKATYKGKAGSRGKHNRLQHSHNIETLTLMVLHVVKVVCVLVDTEVVKL